MNQNAAVRISKTLTLLHQDARSDRFRMIKGAAKSIFGSFEPKNFEAAYLAISKEQGDDLVRLIKEKKLKNIIEFGTSFGISTLYLAQGALATGGHITTTELLKSKAEKAIENFKDAGVAELIEVKIGDAMETLKGYSKSIDLLLLDGWKDLYLPLFRMLEPNYTRETIIYVDNADMNETKEFLAALQKEKTYCFEHLHQGKAVLIRLA